MGKIKQNMSRKDTSFLFCIAVWLNLCLYSAANSAQPVNYIVRTFKDETNIGKINHLVVNKETGKVYVGAQNKLYQLSENLVQQKSVITGPIDDAPNCRPNNPCECSLSSPELCKDYIKKPTTSVCKALVIDYEHSKLITCHNVLQGHCAKRDLDDITQKDADIWEPVVPFDNASSTVMFIGRGPPLTRSSTRTSVNVLYVGATRPTIGETSFKDKIYALSSRRLDNFGLTFADILHGATKLEVEQSLRDLYKINYKYGFFSGGFSYFLTVQKERPRESQSPYLTKIQRVCGNDTKFQSYAEMTLMCKNNTSGVIYNVLQGAFTTRPGSQLAQSLGLAHDTQSHLDDVLFGVFTVDGNPAAGSALCMYSLREVRRMFTRAIQECFKGRGNTGPDYLGNSFPCTELVWIICSCFFMKNI